MKRNIYKLFASTVILSLMLTALPAPHRVLADGSAVFINEIHYDNTGTDAGEAIEVAGPAGTDLTGWSLVLYNGSNGAVYDTDVLTGTIPDLGGSFGVVIVNYPSNGIQNGAPDGLALVDAGSTVVQFLSYEGSFIAVGGAANGMTSVNIGVSENGSGAVGNSLQLTGSGTTYDDFTWAAEASNTFGTVNTGQIFGSGPVTTNPSGTGAAEPNLVQASDTSLLTVTVTPGENPTSTGLGVSCDMNTIGGSATQVFYDDGTNGDGTASDNIFSYSATIAGGTTAGSKSLTCTISDLEERAGSAVIGLTVFPATLPIGTVQGAVSDSANGATFRSPYAPASGNGAGQQVTVQGVIFEKAIQPTAFGGYYGFFIQNTAATKDNDPFTSDGLYVYMSTYTTISGPGGSYTPTVGDEVVISGTISEYYNMTELSYATLVKPIVRSGVDLDAELAPIVVEPPANLQAANRYWERMESMRVQIPANSIVLGGRNVFSPADAEIWVASPDSTIAQRTDPYARRAFRDAHPLDDNYDASVWDGNGYRVLLGSWGVKAAAGNSQALIDPARTFSTVTNAPAGGLNYTFSKYRIEIDTQPAFSEGVDPAANNPPQTFDRSLGYSIVDYNLENLYDYRDNPFSGCDFTGNSGCPKVPPFLDAIKSPFNYVPASEADYQARLNDIALQIINDLHNPDILMLQEVENQDFCTVTEGTLTCGITDNADGKPDVLQDLVLKIASLGGPDYGAAFDRDSSDLRGIAPAFLYRTDRVQLVSPVGDPILGSDPAIDYAGASVPHNSDISNPKTLNAVLPGVTACETSWVFPRASVIGLFRIYHTSIGLGSPRDVYVINNHFKSGPDTCVAHRTEQARYNAAIVAFLQAENPNARIALGGDLNVYPRPDNTALGATEQLGSLYDPDLGLANLWDVLLAQAPESAYSYVYLGMAQTLDQIFVNQVMRTDLQQVRIAHINSDFPADYPDDVARGTSDHDPNAATFSNLPTIDRLQELVLYYDANGMITGKNTTRILLDWLERALRYQQNGKQDAYQSQLQAFIDQVYDFTPQFIMQEAADSLIFEATLLKSLP
ncbi:MAG: hypothetical protein A2X25_00450 [Chloroflexi bacterium GWB2_49_20]|nr:MAG: hypothetical protein A2X25_00450 [Chloroflexi bacterium GWB2_49_20]OGN80150.1 MAG: hypothetical protein A2X26_09305 [Chloroflexi bacterium GWC2_49_37]OGN83123.1 MAG: hypothetical protein A2X27_13065 [Chloroflexi bacterium GWD2_49_16]